MILGDNEHNKPVTRRNVYFGKKICYAFIDLVRCEKICTKQNSLLYQSTK